MGRSLKKAAVELLAAPGLTAPFYPLMRGRAAIFMLHRFHDPERGIHGTDPAVLRQGLELLRRRRYELVSLHDLFQRLRGEGPPLKRAVAFTIDDGYVEQALVAGPAFAAYDCPVTTFVATGFLDRQLWFWWDRIAFVFRETSRSALSVELGGQRLDLKWSDAGQRASVQQDFTERCKRVPNDEKLAAIERLASAAGVALPIQPPPDSAPMSWDELRAAERSGMSFGPHTVTHPILSRATDDQARAEIADSWRRLSAMASNPVPVFCYPNGGWDDFGRREIDAIRDAGLLGSVVGSWGLASSRSFHADRDAPFKVRRFPFPDDLPDLVQYVSGVERLKLMLRGQDL